MTYRHFKDIIKYLAILALGFFIICAIRFFPEIYSTAKLYFDYQSQTADLSNALSMDIYFDNQLKHSISSEEVPVYIREIRDVTVSEIMGSSACPFYIKLVFTLPDKQTYDVLIGTDGCRQIQLENGWQSSFPSDGKLAELEKEYRASQNDSPQGEIL